jgi:mannose-1-phosphate guanylyltransferase
MMKAFLLAAGHGTRLRPLTDSIPKCLVPVQGTPILAIWLGICRSAGITDLLVNVHAHAAQVRDFVASCSQELRVTVSEEEHLLGSAGTLSAHREWVAGEQEFWVLYCDVLTNMDLPAMLAFHRSAGGLATIGAYSVADPSQCGVIATDGTGRVVGFMEKPRYPESNLVFAGILLMRPSVLDLIPERAPTPDIAYDVLPKLIGKMHAYPVREFLLDIGTKATLARAQKEWPGLSDRAEHAALPRAVNF